MFPCFKFIALCLIINISTRSFAQNAETINSETFVNTLIPAQFIGGEAALLKFIAENFEYNSCSEFSDSICNCIVEFEVDTFGNVKVLGTLGRKPSLYYAKEAMRVINATSGLWIPGREFDKVIVQRLRIPIRVCSN